MTILFAGIIISALQIPLYQLLQYGLGQTFYNESLLIATLYIGMVLGLSGRINIKKYQIALMSLAMVILGVFYNSIILNLAESLSLTYVFILLIFIINIVAGVFLTTACYKGDDFHDNYFKINLITSVFIFASIIVITKLGHHYLITLLGISLLAGLKKVEFKTVKNSGPNLQGVLLGVISAAYISIYFQITKLLIYPTGFEYFIYLLFTFLFLSIGTKISEKINLSAWTVSKLGYLMLLGLVLPIGLKQPTLHFLVPQKILGIFPWNEYSTYSIWLVFLFLIPYLMFSMTLPLLEKNKDVNKRQLFSISLGNVIGLILFSGFLANIDLNYKMVILSIILITEIIFLKPDLKRGLLTGVILIASVLTPKVGSYLKQGFYFSAANYKKEKSTPFLFSNKKEMESWTTQGKTGFVLELDSYYTYLGLDGYITDYYYHTDLLRAISIASIIRKEKQIQKVLVLGRGNELILSIIRANNLRGKIDVVDNFPVYHNQEFVEKIRQSTALIEHESINFITADAFNFLARNPEDKYDLIIYNLTWPRYNPSSKLYTTEAYSLINNRLNMNGYFFTTHFGNPQLDCTFANAFDKVDYFPKEHSNPGGYSMGFLLGQKGSQLKGNFKTGHCVDYRPLVMANPYLKSPLEKYGFKKGKVGTSQDKHLLSGIAGELVDFFHGKKSWVEIGQDTLLHKDSISIPSLGSSKADLKLALVLAKANRNGNVILSKHVKEINESDVSIVQHEAIGKFWSLQKIKNHSKLNIGDANDL